MHMAQDDGGAGRETPWIETKAGAHFFVQALLIAPVGLTLLPLVLGGFLRVIGVVEGPSRVFDTIPAVAWYFLPRVGWISALIALSTIRTLRVVDRTGPKFWLYCFLVAHIVTTGLCVWRWYEALL